MLATFSLASGISELKCGAPPFMC